MVNIDQTIWQSAQTAQLAGVLSGIKDKAAMQAFLNDVLTPKEIIEISARLEAAKMLQNGATYDQVTNATKLSSRTVARISDWLKTGAGGYGVALSVISHADHAPPVSAA